MSDSDKSYREASTRCSGNPDSAIRECFPAAVISLGMTAEGDYPGERETSTFQTEGRTSGKAGKW